MKKGFCLMLALILVTLAGCQTTPADTTEGIVLLPTGDTQENTTPQEGPQLPADPGKQNFRANYLRLNWDGGPNYTEVLRSYEEFRGSRLFSKGKDTYDQTFFESQCLAVVYLEEGSGSIRHRINAVAVTPEGLLDIALERIVPETCTDDMAYWAILAVLPKDTAFSGILVNGQPLTAPKPSGPAHVQSSFISSIGPALSDEDSQALWDFLESLDYQYGETCDCSGEYTILTHQNGRVDFVYSVKHMEDGNPAVSKSGWGQAELTADQLATLKALMFPDK